MNALIKILLAALIIAALGIGAYSFLSTAETTEAHDDHGNEEAGHDDKESGHEEAKEGEHEDEEEEGTVELPADSAGLDEIQIVTLQARNLPRRVTAPGEVRPNSYLSASVTTRIAAQVVSRSARLGESVQAGQALATLSSVEVAEAQGEAQLKTQEWARVKQLGKDIVGGRRYQQARIEAEQARARLLSYGLTESEITGLITNPGKYPPNGSFTLYTPRAGTVMRDDFVQGEFVDAGRELFRIVDESLLWVQANLPPEQAAAIEIGAAAEVHLDGQWIGGKVVQMAHQLDETTRTIPVRIEVAATSHRSHGGEFVQVRIDIGDTQQALAVPEGALVRTEDGDWGVFLQTKPRHFKRIEVEVVEQFDGLAVLAGLEPGVQVVTAGAFFLNSELAKGGFDIHNH